MVDSPRGRFLSSLRSALDGVARAVNKLNRKSPVRFPRVLCSAPSVVAAEPESAARIGAALAQIGIDQQRAEYIRFHVDLAQRLGVPAPQFGAKS
jgi:hypothetical protein